MVKTVGKRFACLLLTLIMLVSFFPTTQAQAAYDGNISVSGLTVTAGSGDNGSWNGSGTTINGSVSPSSSTSCGNTTYSSRTGSIIIKNSSGNVGLLSFRYTVDLNGGSASIDNNAVAGNNSFSKTLGVDEAATISITSCSTEEKTTKITLEDIKFTPKQDVSITFKAPVHGSYTVDGTPITADTTITKENTEPFVLNATPASGYKFFQWENETTGSPISTAASFSASFSESATVSPVFVPSSAPVFQVGSMLYTDLNEATDYAVSSGIAKIVLISNGTLPAGDYTIPNGKTLLIPFDEAQTVYTTAPGMTVGADGKPAAHVNPSAFRTLTMANGAKITVASGGAVSVPSMLSAVGTNSGSWNATPTGKHGRIAMNAGSSIDVQSGGKLYVYGYISGSGNVYARSGSEIWECFQIRCWRGGTATSGMADNSQKVFPLNQYYVQNIEAPVTYYPGATEKVFAAVNMSNQQFGASATFIGNGGMFQISNGSATKRFTGASDRLELSIDGDFSVSPMSLRITGLPLIGTLDLYTADYVLPIQSNITLNINSGTTTVSQDVAFMPGSEMSIADGATATIASGHKAYVYDQDQWGAYAASGAQLVVVGYSTVNGTTAKRTAASLVDVKIDVNGTLNVAGSLYTTESGAAIVSTGGTGKVVLASAPGKETNTYMATQSGSDMTYVSIPITAAKLQNADGSYVETADKAAGDEIPYANGVWGGKDETYRITLVCEEDHHLIDDKTEEDLSYAVERAATFTMPQNIFVREGFQFAGWTFTAPGEEGDNTVYTAGQEVPFATVFPEGMTERTLYSVWKQIFTVTFIDQEGQQVGEVQQVASGEKPVIPEGPTAEPTQMYTYEFIGWFDTDTEEELTADTVIIANTVFEAKYLEHLRSYTVTFQDEEGNKIGNDQTVAYGSQPEFPENPGKDGDEQYSYSFEGWYVNNTKIDPETFTVEGDVTIVAKFTPSVNSYEIKFVDYDGRVLKSEELDYGTVPTAPADPRRASTAQYDYTFAGWDPEIHAVSGAQTYTATYTESTRSYTVKFLDYDGTELKSEKLLYGAVPVAPDDPSRASTAQYDYTFNGWDKEITEVKGDVTYTATYKETLRSYTVTFVDEDGSTELKTEKNVTYGSQIPAYVPEKEGYDFIAWLQLDGSAAPETVTGDLTLKASWQIKTFTVTWYDENGTTVLATNTAEYNQKPTVPDIVPAKASDETWDYTFDRWDDLSDTTVITEDTSFKAVYTATLHDYTITWILGNGQENIVKTYHYGDILIVPENPVKASTEQYDYSFTGWDPALPDLLEVTGDATFTAQYDETLRSYEIKFVDYDNTLIDTQMVKYGQTPVAPADPTRDADEQYTYAFAGWNPAVAAVTGEQTYTATYTPTTRSYTVTFLDEKGATLVTQTVEYGTAPAFPAVPEQYYDESGEHVYSFDGWYVDSEKIDPDTFVVTGAVTIKAQYNEGIAEYTIKFVNEDGTVLDEQTLAYGATPVYGGQKPTKAPTDEFEYSFKAWSPAITSVTCDATYTATFEASTRSYTITFYDEDKATVLDQQDVKYGELPVYAGQAPVKAPDETYVYVFAGWDPEIHAVTGEQTYTATYTPEQPSYTVTWKFNNGEDELVEDYLRGETIVKPADPVKTEDAQYFYSFTGWSPEVPEKIDRDMVFNAVYDTTLRSYEIKFVNYDGTQIGETQTVKYGQTPDAPADPTREADEQYTYAFAGWNPAVAAVTGEQTYTATYTPTTRQYTVTFLNEDGTTIANKRTDYNTTPEYPEVPEKIDETGEFLYAFDAWYVRTEVEDEIVDTKIEDPENFKILGDVTIVLKYSKTTAEYAVIFQDDAGQQIGETQMVAFGSKPVYPDDPTKVDPNGQFVYSFDGWYVNGEKIDKDSFVVNGAVTIAARFTSETAKYEIRFLDAQGEQIGETQTVEYGSAPTVPEGPAKEQDDTYTYAFIGWFVQGDAEKTIVTDFTVRGDAVYAPKYESAFRTYTILFVDDEGKVLDTQSLHYGDMPTAPTNPEKAPTELGSFTFVKWDKEITSVTGDATYTAIFSYTGWKIAENGERTYFVEDELQKTGLTTIDGKLYYLDPETGVAAAGWQNFNDKALYDWYYFDPVTGAAASGVVTMQETFYFKGDPEKTFDITYTFDPETHKLIDGTWISYGDSQENPLPTDNQRLRWAGYFPTKTWIKAGEETYYLNASGFRVKGTVPAPVDGETDKYGLYIFNEANGALVSRVETEGFYSVGDETYYLIDNYVGYWGLIKVDGNYYYVKSNTFTLVKNQEYTITKINGLDKQKGSYLFDEEGRMLDGIVTIDGKMYFYKEGKKFYEGLYVEYYDANDNKLPDDQGAVKAVYYYFTSRTFEAVCNQRYYITKTNDLLPRGYYTFDENCQYIVFLQREGIVEEGGKLYFYENGKKVYKGLYVEYYDADGNKLQSESGAAKAVYYYFTSRTFEAVTNANYYVTRNNDLLPKGYYYFDENGQYIVVLAKNGIVEEDGNLYFYQDGKKIYAGLVQDENGDFYYFTSRNFSAVKGKSYYITKTNDLLPRGTYTFDADGKLVR